MRKKALILLLASIICTCSFAQKKVTIKAGTIVPLESVKAVRATQVHEGEYVNFTSTDVYIKGVNRTPLSIIIFCFTCLPFPCGGKAEMKQGYEVEATVANNTSLEI